MLIAFQGGDVSAEIFNSELHLKAGDLLAILGVEQKCMSYIYKHVKQRSTVKYICDPTQKEYKKSTKYIALSEVLSFLDVIHLQTRLTTIQLMMEVKAQFNRYL